MTRCTAVTYRDVRPSATSRATEHRAVRCTLPAHDRTTKHSNRGKAWR